jgi:DNA-directed RNA polymerase subunit RPC12/RpoP
MGSARFDTTFSFSRYRADAAIRCPCGHERIVTAREIAQAFTTPLPIAEAERRLKCSKCSEKRAKIIPIPAPTR